MLSRIAAYCKSIGTERNPVVQPIPSVSDLVFEIRKRRRRCSDDNDIDGAAERQRKCLIRNQNTYLEAYLNFHSKLVVLPFRLNKNGEVASTDGQKVITSIFPYYLF